LRQCSATTSDAGASSGAVSPGSAATVTVIREWYFIGGGATNMITLDGEEIFGLASGEHVTFPVAAGAHVLGVRCFGGLWPAWAHDTAELAAETGKTYFYRIKYSADCATIRRVTEPMAIEGMKDTTPMPMKTKENR
jgi:hypothetical protein